MDGKILILFLKLPYPCMYTHIRIYKHAYSSGFCGCTARASGLIVIFCFVDLVHWSMYCVACIDFAASRRLIINP